MQTTTPQKVFWDRPEGKTGAFFLIVLGLVGAFGLYHFLPAIIFLLKNTLYAMFLFAAVGGLTFLALDPKVRTLIATTYKIIMKKMTGIIIELDPIAIIEGYVDDLKKNLGKMDEQIGNLRGQMRSLQNLIEQNARQMKDNLKLASAAKEKGNSNVTILKSRKAGRLKDSNMTLNALYVKMEKLYRVLSKMYEAAGVLLEDIQDEVEVKKRERQAILAGHSAFKSAMKVISGDPDKQALFNQTMEWMADDLGAKVGEMERFMELSTSFLDSVDLQNGIYQEEGFNLLEEWEREGTSFLLGEQKQVLLAQAEDNSDILDFEKPLLATSKTNKYMELLNK